MNEELFKAHFIKGMKNKDFEAFKKDYPTLFNCIISAMDDLNPPACPECDSDYGYTTFAPNQMYCDKCRHHFKISDIFPNSVIYK